MSEAFIRLAYCGLALWASQVSSLKNMRQIPGAAKTYFGGSTQISAEK